MSILDDKMESSNNNPLNVFATNIDWKEVLGPLLIVDSLLLAFAVTLYNGMTRRDMEIADQQYVATTTIISGTKTSYLPSYEFLWMGMYSMIFFTGSLLASLVIIVFHAFMSNSLQGARADRIRVRWNYFSCVITVGSVTMTVAGLGVFFRMNQISVDLRFPLYPNAVFKEIAEYNSGKQIAFAQDYGYMLGPNNPLIQAIVANGYVAVDQLFNASQSGLTLQGSGTALQSFAQIGFPILVASIAAISIGIYATAGH
jgi:hypothetical protein